MWKSTMPKIFCLSKFLLRIPSDFDGFPESPAVRWASLTISALQAVFVKPVRHRENKRDRKRTSNRSRRRKILFPTYKIFSESNTRWIGLWGGVKKNQRRALACVVCCVQCTSFATDSILMLCITTSNTGEKNLVALIGAFSQTAAGSCPWCWNELVDHCLAEFSLLTAFFYCLLSV